MALVTLIKGQ